MVVCRGFDGGGESSCSKLGCHVTTWVGNEITDGKVPTTRSVGATTGNGLRLEKLGQPFDFTGLLWLC